MADISSGACSSSSSPRWGCEQSPESITLRGGDCSVCVHYFGATVTSWRHNGQEQLYLSSKALFDQKKAIRGGIPVVFPQFGRPNEAMSQHGFARTSEWALKEVTSSEEMCSVTLVLSQTPSSLTQWPHDFLLQYTIALSPTGLKCVLEVTNTGNSEFKCHTLLHTYFRTPHISRVRIFGYSDVDYWDKVTGEKSVSNDECVVIDKEIDRIYTAPNLNEPIPDIRIVDKMEDKCLMRIEKSAQLKKTDTSCTPLPTDCVLWNGWREKCAAMADMDDMAFENYVCVEPGTVSDFVRLAPGEGLCLQQNLFPN